MRFTIFNVPFLFSFVLLTKEKALQTLSLIFAQIWRGVLVGVLGGALAGLFAFFVAHLGGERDDFAEALSGSSEAMTFGLPLFIFVIFFSVVISYLVYYTVFVKEYNSFDREYKGKKPEKFLSWLFWKPLLLTMLVGLVIELISALFLWAFHPFIAFFVKLAISFFATHCYLHGGTWGFVPVSRSDNVS